MVRTRFLIVSVLLVLLLVASGWTKPEPAELLKPRNDLTGLKNFAQVSPMLCRGAQPGNEGFRTLKKMGVKTVINLRALHSDRKELKGLGLQYVHIPCQAWNPSD